MERIAAAHVDSPFEFEFAPAGTHARQLVRLEHATLRYGNAKPVFEELEFAILAGDLALAAGTRHTAQNLVVGYFAQHQLEQLDLTASPLLHLRRIEPQTRDQVLRSFLGGFDFRGDMVEAPVERFSGGEKARLVLAMIVRQRPQLLILDEPTNHLDIEMREALAEALQAYDGALVVVAHDRHLLAATTDSFLLVDGGRVTPFDGDLDDYRDWVLGAGKRSSAASRAPRTWSMRGSACGMASGRRSSAPTASNTWRSSAGWRKPASPPRPSAPPPPRPRSASSARTAARA